MLRHLQSLELLKTKLLLRLGHANANTNTNTNANSKADDDQHRQVALVLFVCLHVCLRVFFVHVCLLVFARLCLHVSAHEFVHAMTNYATPGFPQCPVCCRCAGPELNVRQLSSSRRGLAGGLDPLQGRLLTQRDHIHTIMELGPKRPSVWTLKLRESGQIN